MNEVNEESIVKPYKSMLNKDTTLTLNADWLPTGYKTGQQAICAMMSGEKKSEPPALGISIDYEITEEGIVNFDEVTNITTHKWDDWVKLPVRPHDYFVSTVRGYIRIPTVILHPKFRSIIKKRPRYTKSNVFDRDGWICQYTGRPLNRSTATIDHVIPRSQGGKTSWENCVTSHKDVNNKKGNKLNHEIGLKLLKTPVVPNGGNRIKEVVNRHSIRLHDWDYFLKPFDKDEGQ